MKSVKRWRHYCEFCKKSSGRKPTMESHERGCTLNPNRVCGHCIAGGKKQVPMDELKALVVVTPIEVGVGPFPSGGDITYESLQLLRDATENCPACILAVLRQMKTGSVKFNFKDEQASFWQDINEDRAGGREGYCDGC